MHLPLFIFSGCLCCKIKVIKLKFKVFEISVSDKLEKLALGRDGCYFT